MKLQTAEKTFAKLLAQIAAGRLYFVENDGTVTNVHEQAAKTLKQFPEYEEFWKLLK